MPFLLVGGQATGLPSLEEFHRQLQLQMQMRKTKKPRLPAENPAPGLSRVADPGLSRVADPGLSRVADQFEYLLVGGIISDYLHYVGYFKQFQLELYRDGVPPKQVHTLFPPSSQSVEHNVANALPKAWAKLLATTDKPIVIIAHSKGAVEMVNFLLEHPELQDRVEAIHCVQGAFGGSELADYLMKEYEQPGRPSGPMGWWPRAGMRVFRALDRVLHGRIAGVESLTTARAMARTVSWYRDHGPALKKLLPKLIFTTTSEDPKKMDLRLRIGGSYLVSVGALENDGAVAEKNQSIAGLRDLSVSINGVDHSLPCGNLIARRHSDMAHAFIRAVLRSIGK